MKKAAWVIAHGSSDRNWVAKVDQIIEKVEAPIPVFISFLENVEGRLIEDGIKELKNRELTEIIVISLFVSSGSTHINEIKEILSKYSDIFNFTYTSCMDDHPLVSSHIIKMAKEISRNPQKEEVVLIGHGSNQKGNYLEWKRILEKLVEEVKGTTNYAGVTYATFYPNTIQQVLDKIEPLNTGLIVPLFLSKGIYTNKRIPEAIKDYMVRYNDKGYIEETWISAWISNKIRGF